MIKQNREGRMAKVKIIFTHAREEGILRTHKGVGLS